MSPTLPPRLIACRMSSYGPFAEHGYEHLADLGIRFVEILVPPADELRSTRTLLDRLGLQASSQHGAFDVTRGDLAAQVEGHMPALRELDTPYLFVSAKCGETPLATVYERLRAAGDAAARHNVLIVMETHPELVTNAEVALQTMQGVNHPNVRVNFDTANIYFYNRGLDGVRELERIAPFVGAVHLKDTNGGYRAWHFPALGRGVVRFRETFSVLDESGYTGPYTLEIEGIEGEAKTERRIFDRIAESVGYLRALGRL
jgi:sugar phosphate isomerase/epimerase